MPEVALLHRHDAERAPRARLMLPRARDGRDDAIALALKEALAGRGLAVVTAPPLVGTAQEVFVSKLYHGAAAGLSPAEILTELTAALAGCAQGA